MAFSPFMSVEAKAADNANIYDVCGHSCSSDDITPDIANTESDDCCSLPCNTASCCMFLVLPKGPVTGSPNQLAKPNTIRTERANTDELIESIFKPPEQ